MMEMFSGMFLVPLLVVVLLLGFAYLVWVFSNKETGGVRIIGQVVAIVLVVFAVLLLFFGGVMGGMMGPGMMGPGMMRSGMMGGGMMGGGMMGPGMMRSGMMGGGMMGPGMMGSGMMGGMPMMRGMMGYYSEVPRALSHNQAKDIANRYLAALNNPELKIDEFEEYSANFYVSLIEKRTNRGAIEIIIDRYYGSYQLEPQSMMWNGKYGMMGSNQQAKMSVTQQQAMKIAQDFLDAAYPGTEADEIVAYYGYYTIMTKLKGKHYGMLSVNGYSGDVWYHTWHGMFISEVE
jgi:hypothetical protein